jgi:hypothetical protein
MLTELTPPTKARGVGATSSVPFQIFQAILGRQMSKIESRCDVTKNNAMPLEILAQHLVMENFNFVTTA